MQKPSLSIILPAIRQNKWNNLYDSIAKSIHREFELIICGPYELTSYLQNKKNVKYIKDFGSPTRASMIAASVAEGKYITWLADDAILLPDALEAALTVLESMGDNEKNVVCTKYLEGVNGTSKISQPDYYYMINGRPGFRPCTYSEHLPDNWLIFNTAIMHRSYFEKLGGLDCVYQHAAMADTDLAIRAQLDGAIVKLTQITLYDCDHGQPDHKPIEIAQLGFDEPYIQNKFRNSEWKKNLTINIDFSNWKNYPSIWDKRFGVS